MAFNIDYEYFFDYLLPTLEIELIGHFSIDGDSQYHADLSQLKYYIPPPNLNNVSYYLDKDSASTRHKPDSYAKLDFTFQWMAENFSRLERPLSLQEERWLDADFICRRGVLKTLLCSPYKKYDGWIICACKYRGTIYLCKFFIDEKQDAHVYVNNTYTTWGYKFEQYMVADHPSDQPDLSVSLNICEEFHCMFKAKFGEHSLLYGAETDGIFSQEPIKDTLIGKKFQLIEFKTSPIHKRMYPGKTSQWWSQNYLAGVNKIICGLKDGLGTVRIIKEYSTDSLPSEAYFDMGRCKMFCKMFLDNVKKIVTKDYNECIYKFHWDPFTKNIINYNEEAPDHKKYFFLKQWFVEKAEKFKNTWQ